MIVVLTGEEQGGNDISEAVKREITQGLQERHGLDKGFAFTWGICKFNDFETCKEMKFERKEVRCIACR